MIVERKEESLYIKFAEVRLSVVEGHSGVVVLLPDRDGLLWINHLLVLLSQDVLE